MPPDAGVTVAIALISALALLAAAVLGTRAAAKINATASRDIARINTEDAREIERIKGDAARSMERDKERREWRRRLVAPILDEMHARTKRLLDLAEAIELGSEPELTNKLLVQLNADLAYAPAMPYLAATTGQLRDALNRL